MLLRIKGCSSEKTVLFRNVLDTAANLLKANSVRKSGTTMVQMIFELTDNLRSMVISLEPHLMQGKVRILKMLITKSAC